MNHGADSPVLQNRAPADVYDVARVRREFPILAQRINGRPLVYLDNAATTQKPAAVIEVVKRYYEHDNANIHRGVHTLSERATRAYEDARGKVRDFINAADPAEVVFVRGATEAINLVANSYGRGRIGAGDEIILTEMEHHSNIVPWQLLCEHTGARLKVVPVNDAGELMLGEMEKFLGPRTKLVAVTHMSNALGTVNPVERIIAMAHACNVPVLVDGAQAVSHLTVDVRRLDCDFYAFSGHKVYAPTGIGVLYAKAALLEAMPPYQGGGDMISRVSFDQTVYSKIPHKFEAGTPHIAGAIGLGAAIDYITGLGMDRIAAHEYELLAYATAALSSLPGVRLIGTAAHKASVLSFVMEGVHPHDIGTILDNEGVAIRAGHHCAMPLMDRYAVPATARASLGLYNTREDVDALVEAVDKVKEIFG
jgi:cysteine desulfurase/selenocysteine lyase